MTKEQTKIQGEIWVPVRRPWSRRKRFWILTSIGILVLMGMGLSSVFWLQSQLDPPGNEGEAILVDIPTGASINDITRILVNKDVVSNFTITRLWWRNSGPYEAGTYSFRTNMSVSSAREVLEAGPSVSTNTITLPEGLWLSDIEQRLLSNFPFEASELDAVLRGKTEAFQIRSKYQPAEINTLEGLLFPDTYSVSDLELSNEVALIQKMVNRFDMVLDDVGYGEAMAKIGLTPYQVVTVASMVEAEARIPEDRPKIARVIYNRINNDMRLDIDATVLFAIGEHKSQLTSQDLQIDSPYNTRRFKGLPPTPIAAPGRAALEAALNPADGDWLYYVLVDRSGKHFFTDDFDEFNRQAALAREQGVFR